MNNSRSNFIASPDRTGLSHRYEEPIAALCSGQGAGAIAVIRISGVGCLVPLRGVLVPRSQTRPMEHGMVRRCRVVDPLSGDVLDEPLAVFFKGPASYTGQDSVELFCHGSPYVVKSILELLYRLAIRAAEPGEFTRRAFLNGKMDLTEAEGIRELVAAQSHQQWVAARYLLDGKLKELVLQLRAAVIDALAYLEANIDFPDEDDAQQKSGREAVRAKVVALSARIGDIIKSYDNGRVAAHGMKVALVGEPNVGKSTLLNTLLGRQRAIVTEIAGTTRDYIEESCLVKGRLIRLVDTAGVRSADEVVERLGIKATLAIAQEADLVVMLIDAQQADEQLARSVEMINQLNLQDVMFVATKADLCVSGVSHLADGMLAISAQNGSGIDLLLSRLAEKVDHYLAPLKEASFITSMRQLTALQAANGFLQNYLMQDDAGQYEECLGFELQSAVRALAAIIGEVDSEDVLERIFSEFCIGK